MFFLGTKRPMREASYSLLCTAEVSTEWNCISLPLYAFVPWTEEILQLVWTLKMRSCHITESRASVVLGRPVRSLVTISSELSRVLGLARST